MITRLRLWWSERRLRAATRAYAVALLGETIIRLREAACA
jgi:hypothetical protein